VEDVAGPAWVQGHVTVLGVCEQEMRRHLSLVFTESLASPLERRGARPLRKVES
jgi:hypothetical protein